MLIQKLNGRWEKENSVFKPNVVLVSANFKSEEITRSSLDILASQMLSNGWNIFNKNKSKDLVMSLCKGKYQANFWSLHTDSEVNLSPKVLDFQKDFCR